MIALLDVGLAGKLLAGAILGAGILVYLLKQLQAGQKAQIEKVSAEAWVKQTEQNVQIVENAKKEADVARKEVGAASNTDW